MNDRALAELIARSLIDQDFQDRLLADPAATLAAEGLEPTPERLAKLATLDLKALKRATRTLEKGFFAKGKPG